MEKAIKEERNEPLQVVRSYAVGGDAKDIKEFLESTGKPVHKEDILKQILVGAIVVRRRDDGYKVVGYMGSEKGGASDGNPVRIELKWGVVSKEYDDRLNRENREVLLEFIRSDILLHLKV